MADDEGGGGGRSDVLFIVFLIVGISAIWFLTGGPQKTDTKNLFLQPGTYSGTTATIGVPSVDLGVGGFDREETDVVTQEVAEVRTELESLRTLPSSPYAGKVQIVSAWEASQTLARNEYITIRAKATNTERIIITGFRLESAISGKSAYIASGSEIYQPGVGGGSAIFLDPGDEAIISTSRSPVGTSFRINSCTGYLSQFQQFTPSLPSECPAPEREAAGEDRAIYTDNSCMNYLQSMQICTIDVNPPLPPTLSNTCRDFIQSRVTYKGCISKHVTDSDFKKRQWRVYLGYDTELWRDKREVIALIDAQGRLIDSTTY